MADISTAENWVVGELVTDTKMDNIIGSAAILPAFVTAKTELVAPVGTEFFNVVDSTGAYKKVKLQNIPGVTSPNPTYVTLTDAATITQACDPNKYTQSAKVTLGGNRTLSITGAASGMYGVILVTQDATGSRTLTLPATSYGLGQTGAITTADVSPTAGVTTACAWTYDTAKYYWTFAKYAVASPLCRAYITSSQAIPHNLTTYVSYGSETQDNDVMHSNVTNPTRLTAQRGGIYLAVAYSNWELNNVGERITNVLINAGGPYGSVRQLASNSSSQIVTVVYPLNPGDYVECSVYQGSGAALDLTASNLTVTRIGAF